MAIVLMRRGSMQRAGHLGALDGKEHNAGPALCQAACGCPARPQNRRMHVHTSADTPRTYEACDKHACPGQPGRRSPRERPAALSTAACAPIVGWAPLVRLADYAAGADRFEGGVSRSAGTTSAFGSSNAWRAIMPCPVGGGTMSVSIVTKWCRYTCRARAPRSVAAALPCFARSAACPETTCHGCAAARALGTNARRVARTELEPGARGRRRPGLSASAFPRRAAVRMTRGAPRSPGQRRGAARRTACARAGPALAGLPLQGRARTSEGGTTARSAARTSCADWL